MSPSIIVRLFALMLVLFVGCAEGTLEPEQIQSDIDSGELGDEDVEIPDASELDADTPDIYDMPDTPTPQGCQNDEECAPLVCNSTTNNCVECTLEAGCSEGQVCHVDEHICRDCLRDTDCPDALNCSDDYECVECQDDGDCDSPLPFCDAEVNLCVRCTDDEHCADGRCDIDEFICVECLGDEDCEGDFCSDEGQCFECLGDEDCADDNICDQSLGLCIGCQNDADCGDDYCRTDESVCVGCVEDDHCGDDICDDAAGQCRQCLIDDDCLNGVCSINYECMECESNIDCDSGYICTDENLCVDNGECVEHSDCGAWGEAWCVEDSCEECEYDFDCESGQICDANYECLTPTCLNNLDCPVIGEVCDAGLCIPNPDTNQCIYDSDCPYNSCGNLEYRCHCDFDSDCSVGQVCNPHLFYPYCG